MKREKQRKGQYAEPEMENAAPTYPAAVVVPEERHDEYHRPQQPIDAVSRMVWFICRFIALSIVPEAVRHYIRRRHAKTA